MYFGGITCNHRAYLLDSSARQGCPDTVYVVMPHPRFALLVSAWSRFVFQDPLPHVMVVTVAMRPVQPCLHCASVRVEKPVTQKRFSPPVTQRFAYDVGELYQALDLDGGGELTLEELDPRADQLFASRLLRLPGGGVPYYNYSIITTYTILGEDLQRKHG